MLVNIVAAVYIAPGLLLSFIQQVVVRFFVRLPDISDSSYTSYHFTNRHNDNMFFLFFILEIWQQETFLWTRIVFWRYPTLVSPELEYTLTRKMERFHWDGCRSKLSGIIYIQTKATYGPTGSSFGKSER